MKPKKATDPIRETSPQVSQDLSQQSQLRKVGIKVLELQVERDQLRERLNQLQAERDQLKNERRMLLHALADLLFPEEELNRRSKEKGGRSLEEIWKRLEHA